MDSVMWWEWTRYLAIAVYLEMWGTIAGCQVDSGTLAIVQLLVPYSQWQ